MKVPATYTARTYESKHRSNCYVYIRLLCAHRPRDRVDEHHTGVHNPFVTEVFLQSSTGVVRAGRVNFLLVK